MNTNNGSEPNKVPQYKEIEPEKGNHFGAQMNWELGVDYFY